MTTPKNILEDIIQICRNVKGINILGTQRVSGGKATSNETPLLAIQGVKISKIIRKTFTGNGEEVLESIIHFLFENSDRIAETSSYLLLDEEGNLYELRKYNGDRLKKVDSKTKEEYLRRVV